MNRLQRFNFSDKKVLVTGARGFIGSRLCNRLLEADAEIHGVSRVGSLNMIPSFRWWKGSLEDITFVRKLISEVKPDYIYHLSGFVSGLREVENVLEAYNSLLTSTVNILTAAAETGCQRLILPGSMEEPDANVPIPSSPYAAAKWACRGYAAMFKELYGTPVVNPRIFMVYGPGQREYKKLIPYVTLSLLNKEIPKLSSGSREIDWVYIDDVINGLIALAKCENSLDDSLDIGTGKKITVKEMVDKLVEITGTSIEPVFGELLERPMERVAAANIDLMIEKTGWKPEVNIDEGLRKTVAWYKQHFHHYYND